jgi:hypothetical protein
MSHSRHLEPTDIGSRSRRGIFSPANITERFEAPLVYVDLSDRAFRGPFSPSAGIGKAQR